MTGLASYVGPPQLTLIAGDRSDEAELRQKILYLSADQRRVLSIVLDRAVQLEQTVGDRAACEMVEKVLILLRD